ncbi:MAG TPA: outer membrane beta-barrel protein [Flavisolibacter sp.]|nr:outer membrane beta-barrel protein [Flavisolibacter sp.]
MTIFFILTFFISISSNAQREVYMEEHDAKPYYFGITIGMNRASFHSDLHASFLQQDSIFTAEPLNTMGFHLGLSATGRISNRFSLRFNPQLIFLERVIQYNLNPENINLDGNRVDKKVESVITSFPLNLKFLSDRIGNFRVYMLGGGKLDIDLASNAQSRKGEDMVKINRYDYGFEAGVGFNFYNKSFILSPEIKISNGLNNLHSRNEALNYSRVLGEVRSRMIMFTIHLEG